MIAVRLCSRRPLLVIDELHGIISDGNHLVRWPLPVRLDAVFHEVPPATVVSDLHAPLECILKQ
jgi:hypothetical protein